jgi:hypothetical protein
MKQKNEFIPAFARYKLLEDHQQVIPARASAFSLEVLCYMNLQCESETVMSMGHP